MINFILASNETDPTDCVMTGDRPEDEGAAVNAGIRFMWAGDWRNGDLV